MLEILSVDLLVLILENLPEEDLSRIGRVCRQLYTFVLPVLYRTVYFRLPAKSTMDKIIHKLEVFTEPSFQHLRHTRRVVVVGSWYDDDYSDLEPDLSHEQILSPAIRMLSILIDVCLMKMSNLRSFIWDAEIPPTQKLVANLAYQDSLEEIQLRLGIDHTPHPLFYPVLNYRHYSRLTTVKLSQINSVDVLRTIGGLLASLRSLKHFYIDVDPDCDFKFSSAFKGFPSNMYLSLRTLYVVGFSDPRIERGAFWTMFHSNTLEDLTLITGKHMERECVQDFWKRPPYFQHCIKRLSTNIIDSSIADFIVNAVYLEALIIHSCSSFAPEVDYTEIINTISRPGRGLRCLGMYPQGQDARQFMISRPMIRAMRSQCPFLSEAAFGLDTQDFSVIDEVFDIKHLRILHIYPTFMDPDYEGDQIINPRQPHKNKNNKRGSPHSHAYLSKTRNGNRPLHPNKAQAESVVTNDYMDPRDEPMRELEQWVLRHLAKGHAPGLMIVAFDEATPYLVQRHPLRLEKLSWLVAAVAATQLFKTPFLDWASRNS